MVKPTKKQMGDAGEMLIAAELTLAGMPALKVPDNWPGYDVVAQPPDGGPAQRVQVKTRTYSDSANDYVEYHEGDDFDWLAVVFLPRAGEHGRQFFIVPRDVADPVARRTIDPAAKTADSRYWSQREFRERFAKFQNNFALARSGQDLGDPAIREVRASDEP